MLYLSAIGAFFWLLSVSGLVAVRAKFLDFCFLDCLGSGVPHHLLGTIPPNVEFTAKKFRDMAIPVRNFRYVFVLWAPISINCLKIQCS